MRITPEQATLLVSEIKAVRPLAEIYLFGSRADDTARGGDIDILIMDKERLTISEESAVERAFWGAFGEQKLDLVCFPSDSEHPFKRLALLKAIRIDE